MSVTILKPVYEFNKGDSLSFRLYKIANPARASHNNDDCYHARPCIRFGKVSEQQTLDTLWHESIHHAIGQLLCRSEMEGEFDEELYFSFRNIDQSEETAIAFMGLFRL